MHQVIPTDGKPVTVAGDDPDRQIRIHRLEARGNRGRTTVNRVDTVGVHVVWEPTGTADAGDKHDILAAYPDLWQDLLHLHMRAWFQKGL